MAERTTPLPDSNAAPKSRFPAERPKAFVDAVVAIALTLLILPLMDSVSEVADGGDDTLSWVASHSSQLLSFVLSFLLIALFWMIHHRLFVEVHQVTPALLWLLAAWMFTIVWLPVATAITGRMSDGDVYARVLYIASLVLTAVMGLVVRLYLRRHPSLHSVDERALLDGLAVDISIALLFIVALIITAFIPGVGYYALFVMFLSGLLQRLLTRALQPDSPRRPKTSPATNL